MKMPTLKHLLNVITTSYKIFFKLECQLFNTLLTKNYPLITRPRFAIAESNVANSNNSNNNSNNSNKSNKLDNFESFDSVENDEHKSSISLPKSGNFYSDIFFIQILQVFVHKARRRFLYFGIVF